MFLESIRNIRDNSLGPATTALLQSPSGQAQFKDVRDDFNDDFDAILKVVFDNAHTRLDLREEFFSYFWHQLPDGWLRGGYPSLKRHMDTDDLRVSTFRELRAELGDIEFRGRAAFRAWLLKRLTWKAMNARRALMAERRRNDLLSEGHELDWEAAICEQPYEILMRSEQEKRVAQAVSRLGEGDRELLRMYMLDMPRAEMAERLGKEEPAVRKALSRAIQKLRVEFE